MSEVINVKKTDNRLTAKQRFEFVLWLHKQIEKKITFTSINDVASSASNELFFHIPEYTAYHSIKEHDIDRNKLIKKPPRQSPVSVSEIRLVLNKLIEEQNNRIEALEGRIQTLEELILK